MTNPVSLRKCPCCAGPVTTEMGLRNYESWLADALPGRVSGSDIDVMIERSSTERVLAFELKPAGIPLPVGQRLLLRTLVRKGIEVWIVWGEGPVAVAAMNAEGETPVVETIALEALVARVRAWWALG